MLILSASAGFGHIRAADALAEAFRSMAASADVQHLDTLQYTSRLYSAVYTRANTYVVRRVPGIARRLYKSLDYPWQYERFRTLIDRLNARPLLTKLKDYQPDVVVCTHFLPAGVVSSLRGTRPNNSPHLITVVTDFHVHGIWLTRNNDQYFVAGEQARNRLISAGVRADRVTAAGIPIGSAFCAPLHKARLLQKHGIVPDSPVILISAGRIGFDRVRAVSDVLMGLNRQLQAILLCGNDGFLKQRLEQRLPSLQSGSAVTFRVVGHSNEMHEMMAISDVIVGRPGGLITAEALASSLPFIIVGRLPGQEERNAEYLVEEGAGVRCTDEVALRRELREVMNRPDVLESMKLSARRIARPRAAFDVVQKILAGAT